MSKHNKTWFLIVVLLTIITAYFFIKKVNNHSKITNSSRLCVIPHPQEIGYQDDRFHDFTVDSTTLIITDESSTSSDSIACNILTSTFDKFGFSGCIYIFYN